VEDTVRVTGLVKWFDVNKGYGFVVADDCETDILLHANVLRCFGQNSVANNAEIELLVQRSERGCQAAEILSVAPPRPERGPEAMQGILGDDVVVDSDRALRPARVKWFDRKKGFGFANVFGSSEDVFLHIEVLQASGLAELLPGEAIAIRTAVGPRGRMAWDIRGWDAALAPTTDASESVG